MVESTGRKTAPVLLGMKDARAPIREASSLSRSPLITLRTYGYICTANCLLTSGPSWVHTIYSFKKQIRFLLHPKITMVEKGTVRIHRLFLGSALSTVFCTQASSAHLNQNMGPDIKSFKPQASGSPLRYLRMVPSKAQGEITFFSLLILLHQGHAWLTQTETKNNRGMTSAR